MGKPPFKTNDILGNYIIEDTFSIGGMGVVYTTKGGNALIKSPFADAEQMLIDQFQEEVEALKQLNHPSIVKILDSGIAGRIPWYAMEKIEGETLRDQLKRKTKLSSTEALRIEYKIVQAMAYAHSREKPVWHRDLKPENICFQDITPVILDFGLARFGTDSSIILAPHGTLFYMPPEQIRGRSDTRTDVYALGVIFYEMLCGHTPFGTSDKSDSSIIEEILDINTPAPRLPGYDESITSIYEKSLNKRAEFRYADATEMVADIKFSLRKHLKKDALLKEQGQDFKAAAELLREAVEYGLPMAELEEFWKFRTGKQLKIVLIDSSRIQAAEKTLILKKHPFIIPILEVIKGEYPYLVVEALNTDPLTKRISHACYLSFSEGAQLCYAIKESLEALKSIDVYLPIEERRIFPGNEFRIAGLHRAKIGYKETPAKHLAKIIVRGLCGNLEPDWQDFPDVYRNLLQDAMTDKYKGDALALASAIWNEWEKQEKIIEEIKKLKNKLLQNIDHPDYKLVERLLFLYKEDTRETVHGQARQALKTVFQPGPQDGDWDRFFDDLYSMREKPSTITKKLNQFVGTIFHIDKEKKRRTSKVETSKQPIRVDKSQDAIYSRELINFFEKFAPDINNISEQEIKQLFEEFFICKEKESTQRIEKERANLLRASVQKDEIIADLREENARLQNLIKDRDNIIMQQEDLLTQMEKKKQELAQIETSRMYPEMQENNVEETNEASSKENFEILKALKKHFIWYVKVISGCCEQILSHLGGERQSLTAKEKQVEEKIKNILDEINNFKMKVKSIKRDTKLSDVNNIIKGYIVQMEEIRIVLTDMIKKEDISRNYGAIYITLA